MIVERLLNILRLRNLLHLVPYLNGIYIPILCFADDLNVFGSSK